MDSPDLVGSGRPMEIDDTAPAPSNAWSEETRSALTGSNLQATMTKNLHQPVGVFGNAKLEHFDAVHCDPDWRDWLLVRR